ncbi:hypothetical protein GBA52_006256 [Prunus armeniaca]|nr:hypothetical protein GBA52_006256 [Prunus armeniaca]
MHCKYSVKRCWTTGGVSAVKRDVDLPTVLILYDSANFKIATITGVWPRVICHVYVALFAN